ncbi:dipeptidyl peptidase 1-like [Amphiura filiformis]|uniref:dipeptidyl peptidase 1-like n=1 Tax=Amphiura filiformis TaxID=82378 RepID=UPI003B21DD02
MILLIGIFALLVPYVAADTPANCSYEEIVGEWTFSVSGGGGDNTLNCSSPGPVTYSVTVNLLYPDVAVDTVTGHKGFWTIIYNQGFEVVLNNKKYFAFSKYTQDGEKVTSICDETLPGWVHNTVGSDWACYVGQKMNKKSLPTKPQKEQMYQTDHDMIKKINAAQNSWVAGDYPEFDKMTMEQMIKKSGGRKSRVAVRPKPALATPNLKSTVANLPSHFDWRDIDGDNYVSPVRDQAACGSCYSFASMAMIEARLRIASNNTLQVVLSPQNTVSCSEYAQGCEGGFPYLIAGKYAEDFGLIEESCYPYEGKDTACKKTSCKRYYATDYKYVGGYYGACNEELMMIQLVKNGPIAVGFEVLGDFMQYKGGIYHHTGISNKFSPFEMTNHAVLVVGYGQDDKSGEKYWIVKNSWSTTWGEKGYFRIRRGTDEVAIESMALESFPIYP